MKKINLYIIPICLLIGLMTACDDTLDGGLGSTMDDESIYSSEALAEQAMYGILVSFAETNSYRGRYIPYYGINSDIEVYSSYSSGSSNNSSRIAGYDATPDNQEMNRDDGPWAKMYEGIERANLCIEGLRTYGNVENNSNMAQILGECITLRAVLYADLLKAWGDVPARFEPVNSDNLYLPKSDRDSIYKRIISDLEEASGLVAWPNETAATSTVERINKAFVKGLRARLCLTVAGYSQRPEGGRRQSYDPDLSVDKMYAIALQECRDIIESGRCNLGDFETTFRELSADVITAGRESLWEIPFATGRGRVAYTYAIRHTNPDKYVNSADNIGGNIRPTANLFYDFDAKDIRRDITCIPYYWQNGIQVPRSVREWYFGKVRYEWMSRVVSGDTDDGINWLYMRYADVLLMAAEAINELNNGPTTEAKEYFKMVRSRAFDTENQTEKVDNYLDGLTNKDEFFAALVEERKWEFAGEAVRKNDLIRWNLLGEKMKETKDKLSNLQKREGEYADLAAKLYYTYDTEDEEKLIYYGLERGHTDEEGAILKSNYGYNDVNWIESSSAYILTDAYIDNLYLNDPDERQFWPIFATYINSSNGMLKNDYGY
ncbi:MAG: RagB/SusD family nutrient uptake outer membrane protein [Tannerellaceae bacterium]|nr:RagB/SusD family nutrient uptake outer membrane protein [Tannerellaceae bacterium]